MRSLADGASPVPGEGACAHAQIHAGARVLGYPPSARVHDLARAGVGLGLTAGPVALADLPLAVGGVLALAAVVFAAYAWQVARRAGMTVAMAECGLVVSPGARSLAWSQLRRVELAYFSVRRDGRAGWFELKLFGAGERVVVDSRLQGFESLAAAALAAAGRRGLELDPTSQANFAALGRAGGVPQGRGE